MNIIDVHSHILPDSYLQAMQTAGVRDVDGTPLPAWSIENHIQMMDKHGIQACVVSISSPGIKFATREKADKLARSVNQQSAEIVKSNPNRFGSFALLPLPNVSSSLTEISHALDMLQLDGVGLYSNYDGAYLGDASFVPVMEELNRRKAAVFIHPTAPPCSGQLTQGFPDAMIEYPFDSTRTVVSMMEAETFNRFPNIRIIIDHGGGTLPFVSSRIEGLMAFKKRADLLATMKSVRQQIGSLFYDLTSTTGLPALSAIRASKAASKLLMGFDFPFMPQLSIEPAQGAFSQFKGFSEEERADIYFRNANVLFPRLAKAIATKVAAQG